MQTRIENTRSIRRQVIRRQLLRKLARLSTRFASRGFSRSTWTMMCALVIGLTLNVSPRLYASEKTKSLDQQLFEELSEDLFRDIAPLKNEQPDGASKRGIGKRETGSREPGKAGNSEVDRQLQRELGGEDLGQGRGSNPLEEVADTMSRVRDRLTVRDTTAETQQMQASIVSSFDQLIAQLQQQQDQQQQQKDQKQQQQQQKKDGQKPGGQKPGSKKPGGQKPGGQKPGQKPGQGQGKPSGNSNSNNAAKDSSTRLGNAEAVDANAEDRDRMMDEAWGNLPAAVRQQLQSARPEKFLPKYSRLIEDYFKRLADEKKK